MRNSIKILVLTAATSACPAIRTDALSEPRGFPVTDACPAIPADVAVFAAVFLI
jgi:hypothetical protein